MGLFLPLPFWAKLGLGKGKKTHPTTEMWDNAEICVIQDGAFLPFWAQVLQSAWTCLPIHNVALFIQ